MEVKTTTRDLCLIALFVAIIAALAQITIPLPFVPLTMQTFAIALAGVVLGARRGAIAAALYLLLGALGVPVFAAFSGGFGFLIGATGGYLLSFPLLAFIAGIAADRAVLVREGGQRLLAAGILAGGLIVGMLINLMAGTAQLSLVMQIGLLEAFVLGMLPFLIPELLKIALIFAIAPKIRQVVDSGAKT
ncbi:MAG: biotin transporter BioY [Coriobacteriia bacterium]|nr:biotin transporter BioY [Coriobacteriia bacterium]MCL2746653.1 biotin transporter BioY [Coriobacteriia bacterium]MCL2870956.1 biotin transporter BioY [Coriobacteriia bacterium]